MGSCLFAPKCWDFSHDTGSQHVCGTGHLSSGLYISVASTSPSELYPSPSFIISDSFLAFWRQSLAVQVCLELFFLAPPPKLVLQTLIHLAVFVSNDIYQLFWFLILDCNLLLEKENLRR